MFIYTVMVAYTSDPNYYQPCEVVNTSIKAHQLVEQYLADVEVADAFYEIETM